MADNVNSSRTEGMDKTIKENQQDDDKNKTSNDENDNLNDEKEKDRINVDNKDRQNMKMNDIKSISDNDGNSVVEINDIKSISENNENNSLVSDIKSVSEKDRKNGLVNDIKSISDNDGNTVEINDIKSISEKNKNNSLASDIKSVSEKDRKNGLVNDIKSISEKDGHSAEINDIKSVSEKDRKYGLVNDIKSVSEKDGHSAEIHDIKSVSNKDTEDGVVNHMASVSDKNRQNIVMDDIKYVSERDRKNIEIDNTKCGSAMGRQYDRSNNIDASYKKNTEEDDYFDSNGIVPTTPHLKSNEEEICYASLVFKTKPGYRKPQEKPNRLNYSFRQKVPGAKINEQNGLVSRGGSIKSESGSVLGTLPLPRIPPRTVKEHSIQTEKETYKKEKFYGLVGLCIFFGVTLINGFGAKLYYDATKHCPTRLESLSTTTAAVTTTTPKSTTTSPELIETTAPTNNPSPTSPSSITPPSTLPPTTLPSPTSPPTTPSSTISPSTTTRPPNKDSCNTIAPCNFDIKDCSDVPRWIHKGQSGRYWIVDERTGLGCIPVYCDMTRSGGGWTLFQRRRDGLQTFDQSWKQYKKGFGDVCEDHWLGNDVLNTITTSRNYTLRLDLTNFDNETRWIEYKNFSVGNESTKYVLNFTYDHDSKEGSLKDNGKGLSALIGMKFSTHDQDNDLFAYDCSKKFGKSGWWWNSCSLNGLNNPYNYNKDKKLFMNIAWFTWTKYYPLKETEMKFRPSYL